MALPMPGLKIPPIDLLRYLLFKTSSENQNPIIMKSLLIKFAVAAFLVVAGFAYSNKGGDATGVKISRVVANDGTFVTLEWNTFPDKRYAVETSIDMKIWKKIVGDLTDPEAPGTYVYPIPNEYVFDSRRFFRVLTTQR
jgi:hypothetical protein